VAGFKPFDALEGEVLGGRYRLGRKLGSGGMGAVYEAQQLELGRRVAVKVLHAFLAEDQRMLARFDREARLAASLNHVNIIQVTDFSTRPGEHAFIVMEYVDGASLSAIIRKSGPLEPGRVVALMRQVLSALAAAHGAGIVHRDIKPGNIAVVTHESIGELAKLLDFGIAKMKEGEGYTRLTKTGIAIGTPAYSAPEQVLARPVDGRTDLYAIGVVMFKCLTGRLPFPAHDFATALRAVLNDEAPSLRAERPDLDPRLADIVACALSKRPDDRFRSAEAMAAALAELSRRPISVHESSGLARQAPPMTDQTPVERAALGRETASGQQTTDERPRPDVTSLERPRQEALAPAPCVPVAPTAAVTAARDTEQSWTRAGWSRPVPTERLRPTSTPQRLVVGALSAAFVVESVVDLAALVSGLSTLLGNADGAPFMERIIGNVFFNMLFALFVVLGRIALWGISIGLFCVWLGGANAIARSLGAEGLRFTPGWCVAWCFVPIANLFKPYQAVKEIYLASEPGAGAREWRGARSPVILPLWWGAWLATWLLFLLGQALCFVPVATRTGQWIILLALVLYACAALLALVVVRLVHARQADRARRVDLEGRGS
jgi:serine/threonine protein kinase